DNSHNLQNIGCFFHLFYLIPFALSLYLRAFAVSASIYDRSAPIVPKNLLPLGLNGADFSLWSISGNETAITDFEVCATNRAATQRKGHRYGSPESDPVRIIS